MDATKFSPTDKILSGGHAPIWQIRPIGAGFLLAVATVGIAWLLPADRALELFAALLALIAAVYVGVAVAQGSQRQIVIQFVVALGFMWLGLLGLWFSPALLVAGYALHGAWDWLHHRGTRGVQLTDWYAPLCLAYDWLVAGAIWWIWVV